MELLMLRLPDLVGSPLSINSLTGDLQVSHKTIAKWLGIFERMYTSFCLAPFGAPNIQSVKKEQKYYLYNWMSIGEEGPKFENLIASHLLKWVHFQQDVEGEDIELKYFRDSSKREVDFVVCIDRKPVWGIEVKLSEGQISPSLKYLKKKFPEMRATQVYARGKKEFETLDGIEHISWKNMLGDLV